jgi:hypothetical protein
MEEIIREEEMNMEMEHVETPEDKIEGLTAEVNQMKRMIEENIRKIAEGDDVEGRKFLKGHLEAEVAKKTKEIAELKAQIEASQE